MKISAINGFYTKIPNNKVNKNPKKNTTFKGIYIDTAANIGVARDEESYISFLRKDALLLNEIASRYPNQDCFLCSGYKGRPRLEYREKPPIVQPFQNTMYRVYRTEVDIDDEEYPSIPLIIKEDSPMNFLIGVPSFISTNPSLEFTVQAGYEVHKKILEKKYQILDIVGKNESIDFGGETVVDKARKAAEDVEYAVTRFLLECSYAVLTDRASARQIYESNYPKAQVALDAKRRLDLTTPYKDIPKPKSDEEELDICKYALKKFPNLKENKDRVEYLTKYMYDRGIILEDSAKIRRY